MAEYAEINRMSVSNLSTVFGPVVLRQEGQSPIEMLKDMQKVHQTMIFLIREYAEIFAVRLLPV